MFMVRCSREIRNLQENELNMDGPKPRFDWSFMIRRRRIDNTMKWSLCSFCREHPLFSSKKFPLGGFCSTTSRIVNADAPWEIVSVLSFMGELWIIIRRVISLLQREAPRSIELLLLTPRVLQMLMFPRQTLMYEIQNKKLFNYLQITLDVFCLGSMLHVLARKIMISLSASYCQGRVVVMLINLCFYGATWGRGEASRWKVSRHKILILSTPITPRWHHTHPHPPKRLTLAQEKCFSY